MAMVFLLFSSSEFSSPILDEYAGRFGFGRDNDEVDDALPFSNMDTTDDMSVQKMSEYFSECQSM
jgi:hypothetical protein